MIGLRTSTESKFPSLPGRVGLRDSCASRPRRTTKKPTTRSSPEPSRSSLDYAKAIDRDTTASLADSNRRKQPLCPLQHERARAENSRGGRRAKPLLCARDQGKNLEARRLHPRGSSPAAGCLSFARRRRVARRRPAHVARDRL